MAKSSLERALDRQRREAKKVADQEARRQRATAIVTGQPQIGGMRIMDAASEEILQIMLSTFDGNTDRRIFGSFNCFPTAYQNSLLLEFEKLSMYGVVSSPHADLGQHRTIAEASAVESPIRQETIGFPAHFFARAHNFKPPGRACQPEADSPMRT